MKVISLNCAGLADETELLALFSRNLESIGYTGSSLDELYDCLTAIDEETYVTVFGLGELAFGEGLRDTLLNAETDNFWLNISME